MIREKNARDMMAVLGVSVMVFLMFQSSASANPVDKYWIGDSGWWDDGSNWSPPGQPRDGDNVYLTQDDSIDRTVWYRNTAYPDDVLDHLYIDATATGTMTLWMDVPHPLTVNHEYIGYSGTGAFEQSGGVHTVTEELHIGGGDWSSPGHGIYNLAAGNLSVGSEIIAYEGGVGTFTQSGGDHNVKDLIIGCCVWGTGAYNLSGGRMGVGGVTIGGIEGTGTFNQSGGTHTVGGMVVGEFVGVGVYNLTAGTLSAGIITLAIEHLSEGTFNQTAGTSTVDRLYIGPEGLGTYNLSGGSLMVKDEVIAGEDGRGIFNQTGGIHTVGDLTFMSGYESGTYNLIGGTLVIEGDEILGTSGLPSQQLFHQEGGSHTVGGTLIIARLIIYREKNTYNLTGGTLTATTMVNNGTFTYTGGDLGVDLINNATTALSGMGIRLVDGDVANNGTFEITETKTRFTGTFTNNGDFISDSSVNHFTDLIIGEDGYMQGDGEDLWYIGGVLLGVEVQDYSVTNIFGSPGMKVYYLPFLPGNEYLRGLTYDLTGGGKLLPILIKVDIDVKPGSDPNSINPKSKGVIPVAILTSENFDATTVDPLSVEFGPGGATESHGSGHIEDVDGDGDLDLVLHFRTRETGIQCGDDSASLTGGASSGHAVEGSDSINTVGCK